MCCRNVHRSGRPESRAGARTVLLPEATAAAASRPRLQRWPRSHCSLTRRQPSWGVLPGIWRREALALTSRLLDQQSGPSAPVRLLLAQEPAENELWMWLECLDDSQPKARWTTAKHTAAAHDLGAFNAQWSARPPRVEDFGWLSQRWLRGWFDDGVVHGGAQHAAEHRDWWGHPLIAAALHPSADDRFAALMRDSPPAHGAPRCRPGHRSPAQNQRSSTTSQGTALPRHPRGRR